MSQRDISILSARVRKAKRDLLKLVNRDQGDTIKALELRWFIDDAEGWLDEAGAA